MIPRIILQTGKSYESIILNVIKKEYPNLQLIVANNLSELIAIPFSTLKKSRLISFSSSNIVPAKILDLLGYGAFNFHPGPPARPGWGSVEKAIYDQDKSFGTTLHRMNEYVDSGPIIAINLFLIPPKCDRKLLVSLTFESLLNLLRQNLKELIESESGLIELPIEWGHKQFTKSNYLAYCLISEDIEKSELDLRVRAFQAPSKPAIRLVKDGKIFELSDLPENEKNQIQLHGYYFDEVKLLKDST